MHRHRQICFPALIRSFSSNQFARIIIFISLLYEILCIYNFESNTKFFSLSRLALFSNRTNHNFRNETFQQLVSLLDFSTTKYL